MPRDKRAWLFKRNERPGWWVGWYHNGKLRKKKFDTKSDAKRYVRKLEGELNANIYYEPSRKTWDQFINEYKENQQPRKKHRTQQEENYTLQRFTEFCQPGALSVISMSTIEKYLAYRRKSNISPATYNKDCYEAIIVKYKSASKTLFLFFLFLLLTHQICSRRIIPKFWLYSYLFCYTCSGLTAPHKLMFQIIANGSYNLTA